LVVRLKHFNADMTGWEAKDDFVSFPLIAQEGDSWFFNGLTFRREGDDGYFVAVRMNHADGSQSDLVFPFRRVRCPRSAPGRSGGLLYLGHDLARRIAQIVGRHDGEAGAGEDFLAELDIGAFE